ncbi:TetR/AcrR family transcriptional regulator [Planktotalea sp.]|uniref:TetR/AcrR family transcriptional regulator n=1 Tax=Planktotalea sp. TaxID=2029877 RepID=UPI003299BCE9
MNVQSSVIRKGRKFDQVLQGAREVFLAEGFDAANMDHVAKVSGVSKATVYSYFPDKEHLFLVVMETECKSQADLAMQYIDESAPPMVVLTEAARHMLGFMTSEFGQRMLRMSILATERFPELGQAFYDSGPMMVRVKMTPYFEAAIERGELVVPDVTLAIDQFSELCKAEVFPKLLFQVQSKFTQAEIDRLIEGAVETFLARYGAKV